MIHVGDQLMCIYFLGLGQGWNLTKIGDELEYQFINQGHRSDYYKFDYYIDGTTSAMFNRYMRLNQSFGFSDNGINFNSEVKQLSS